MTSLAFLYVILPVAMAAFLLCPPVWRPGAMLAISLGFYAVSQPRHLSLLLGSIAIDWLLLLLMGRYDHLPSLRKGCVFLSVVKNLFLILLLEVFLQTGSLADPVLGLHIISISSLLCVLETYHREAPAQGSLLSFALYCSFFPRLQAGPLVSYRVFTDQLEAPNPSLREMARGLGLYLQGAVKAGVLGVSLYALYQELCLFSLEDVTIAGSWCTLLVLALAVYYELSGFGVMAQGVAAMMGIRLPQNFYFPYQSRSVTDFFQRFNMTVSAFLQKYVYHGLGGSSGGRLADSFNLLLTGMLMGLWFGIRINYILWGAFLAFFVILERYAWPGMAQRVPLLFCRLYTFCIVLSSFAIFGGGTLSETLVNTGRMFGLGGVPFFNDRLGYLLSSNWLLLLVSLLFATSAVSLLLGLLKKNLPRLSVAASTVTGLFLFFVLTAFSL